MFKVGMGEVPPTPATLSKEGQQFLGLLLRHDPRLRATAPELLQHHFLKVSSHFLSRLNSELLSVENSSRGSEVK